MAAHEADDDALSWLTFLFCISRFLLQFVAGSGLDQGVATLHVVETNPFKHLTHLSLKFLPGSDAEVKKYLANCLKNLQVKLAIYLDYYDDPAK